MTVIETLRQSIMILNGINVPIVLIQQIGTPISNAIAMIQASANVLEKSAQEQAQREDRPEDQEAGAEPEEGAEENDERTDV